MRYWQEICEYGILKLLILAAVWRKPAMDEARKPRLLKASEAAKMLDTYPQRIGQLIRDGELPGVKIGKLYYLDIDRFEERLEAGYQKELVG